MKVRQRFRTSLVAVAALGLIVAACGGEEAVPEAPEAPAPAEAPAAPEAPEPAPEPASLAGESITVVVGVGPGGGYDAYARLLAPALAEELDATVVVSNEPGAGGLVALTNLLNSPADGTRIMLINGVGIAGSVLAEAEGVTFDLDGLGYIGRMYAGSKLITAGSESGYGTWQDVVASTEPFVFGASGAGASTYVEPTVFMEVMGQPYEIITGYAGSAEIRAGMAAGEVDGISLDLDSVLPTIQDGGAVGLVLMGASERSEDLPDVPLLRELDLTADQRASADALNALIEFGRTLVVHPDTDPAIIDLLSDAVESILLSESFVATAEEQGRPIGFASAEEVREQVATILNAPPAFRDIVKKGY